jgi:hypothetical protein
MVASVPLDWPNQRTVSSKPPHQSKLPGDKLSWVGGESVR